ncbi:probable palmitoyltransferase ZDHHC24 isoform X1 [Eleutherodactylus coqui]
MQICRWDLAQVLPVFITCILVSSVTLEIFYLSLTLSGSAQLPLLVVILYLFFNVVGNMVRFIQSNPSIKGVFLEHGSVGQGWVYCYSCQTHIPPRCHHCYNCNVCVLRRDHHCTLLGKCVGYSNYRYFFCALLNALLALLLATILNAEIFMDLLHQGFSLHSFFLLLMPWMMFLTDLSWYRSQAHMPVVSWIHLLPHFEDGDNICPFPIFRDFYCSPGIFKDYGQVSGSAFVFAFVADTCVVGFLFCLAFLVLHSFILYRGSTTKEWFNGHSRDYDYGWKKNARTFLGERWYLVWLSPWIQSTLTGDGINFEPRNLSTVSSKNVNQ